ncbi:hypothetical protein A1O3_04666 [Capronia epimyces CBS 606.96]|uniref:F-box domain-containing protein n=1 Tax=Capronia epimyces CBS 606.96 TaxID=1182542 RepID=W9YP07_9EURO|nr:uncharacterized protein A1O3_04666 [Capronia epimyces CBS 606.96]EXJ83999.1 hypothetical protein A1O3_04666 [Capronia epimyces CBS 606.96]
MTFQANHLYSNGPDIQGAFGVDSVPLTIVAHIISYLEDDVASLAQLCRTSRVLFYMTLPHLWNNVALKSYSSIRYKDELPEGFGGASPFSMGLNALVTRNVSRLVRSLALEGEIGAADLDEYARAGRVSESEMILNIAIRAAIDQCVHLRSFKWDLDTRRQPNVYAGLAKLSSLETLWLKLPTNRSPQPVVEAPPLPNLKSLTITHYDPFCFPDDFSTLFLHASKLEVLNMHFSPRMRERGETSVMLTQFFRKNIAAKKKLYLKKIGVYNLLPYVDAAECVEVLDSSLCEDFTALNTFGLDEDAVNGRPATHFIDRAWMVSVDERSRPKRPKTLRLDQLHKRHALDLGKSAGLERLYLINARYKAESAEVSPRAPSTTTSGNRSARPTPTPNTSLRDLYLDSICDVCGPTLKHLILPARWLLPTQVTARLIRSCPNLTQLSAAIQCVDLDVLRILVPFLSKLWAMRILSPILDLEGDERDRDRDGQAPAQLPKYNAVSELSHCLPEQQATEVLEQNLGTSVNDFPKLRYIGVGDAVWEVGGVVEEVVSMPVQVPMQNGAWPPNDVGPGSENTSTTLGDGWHKEVVRRRKIKRIRADDVKHIEIWKMDSMDII